MTTRSPEITSLSWGQVETTAGTFRDAKLWPGGARAWDWNETGTHHSPGIQPADVAELLDHGPSLVVLSQGQQGRLEVMPDTRAAIEDEDVVVEVHRTGDAVDRYNTLARDGAAVAALIHSTC